MSLEVDIYSWHPFLSTYQRSTVHQCNCSFPFHVPRLQPLLALFTYQSGTMNCRCVALQKTFSLLVGTPKPAPFRPWTSFWIWLGFSSSPAPPDALSNSHLPLRVLLQGDISSQVWQYRTSWAKMNSSLCRDCKEQLLRCMGLGDKPVGIRFLLRYYQLCDLGMLPYLSMPQFPPKKKKKSGNSTFPVG